MEHSPYKPQHKIRIVTAASLFDGHDASINIMRRILQASGLEVIHLGHNRSVQEIVNCAIQEGVQAIAITSYQGGHLEYLKYMFDLLKEKGASHIKIFAGGGGTIFPSEIEELHQYGITRIYSPDDGRAMGLQGMINDLVRNCDFDCGHVIDTTTYSGIDKNPLLLASMINRFEKGESFEELFKSSLKVKDHCRSVIPVIGITGTGGAGKSSLTDELVQRFLNDFPEKHLAIISIDPSKRKTGGALLGDRIRMNAIDHPHVYMRSLATRESHVAISRQIGSVIRLMKEAQFDLILVETAGIGQSDSLIVDFVDVSMYVMTPEYGAASQLEKIDMIDYADLVVINKFDKQKAQDALREVRKQYQRAHGLWDTPAEKIPVIGAIASQFNDSGVNSVYQCLMQIINHKFGVFQEGLVDKEGAAEKQYIIPPHRVRYLAEIVENLQEDRVKSEKQAQLASELYQLHGVLLQLSKIDYEYNDDYNCEHGYGDQKKSLQNRYDTLYLELSSEAKNILESWEQKKESYKNEFFSYQVRGKEIKVSNFTTSLSQLKIPKVSLPKFKDWGDILRWNLRENIPGEYPYTAGVYPFRRQNEDPTRMFAGEGGPEETNRRFHYLSHGMPATRLSTAFDSVTLYGENPDYRPDIYGKIGNSGVSTASLDDIKKLYSGFNLCLPSTSVSMTINGPAPMILAYFLNTAVDQQCEKYILQGGLGEQVRGRLDALFKSRDVLSPRYRWNLPSGHDGLGLMLLGASGDLVLPREVYEKIKVDTLTQVRGTVQADILKEDQAQNTCIFSTEFALKMMGDVQEYFIVNKVRNFYSVSISGYHIAEAGANPITQLAFTLSNGFTFVEYYLSRGLKIDDFAPNLSFFFSNGIDPEYAVIGRVARRIWAKTMKQIYKGSERSQMLKYHIQTSGRSLHAQEIAFNDIRTTLQALYAIYDNCNSLHTNAYDEAITTPTEESVRRAMAIQLIINRELGLNKNENPLQGAFIIEELTDLVEEAVWAEFLRLSERGGVLGAMENMYQRSKIQEESLYYESLKHTGEYPIVGVNTFLDSQGSPTIIPTNVIRSSKEDKEWQIENNKRVQKLYHQEIDVKLKELQHKAKKQENIFEALMDACKVCTLGQMTNALYEIGGRYRRSM